MIRKYRTAYLVGFFLGCFLSVVTAQLFANIGGGCEMHYAVPFLSLNPAQARPEMLPLHIQATLLLTLLNLQRNGFWFLIALPLFLCGMLKLDQLGEERVWAWSLSKSFWLVTFGDFCVAAPWGMGCGFVDTDVAKYLPYELWYGVQAVCFLMGCSVFALIAPITFCISYIIMYALRKAKKLRRCNVVETGQKSSKKKMEGPTG